MKRPAGRDLLVLLLLSGLATAILLTNPWFSLMDDEAYQVGSAAQPIGIVATQFKTSDAQLHPPLPDILLHFWLQLTRNSLVLLRLPSTLFFVLGIWISSLAATQIAGAAAGRATVILGVLWPYGFHFGRYAVWLSFCFFLLACLLYAYVRWIEQPRLSRFCALFVAALALLYTNYMGWAFLFVLALDFLFRSELRSREHRRQAVILGIILVIGYLPVWPEFLQQLRSHHAVTSKSFLMFLYSFYVLFASESIAPWIALLSVPLCVSIAVCSGIILFRASRFGRLLFGGTLLLGLALAFSGEINQKRLMPLGAWMLIAAGIAFATVSSPWRRLLAAGFAVIGIVSWFGIVSQSFYSTPRVFEPWAKIAQTATDRVIAGDTLIASHPAFLFYLTRDVMSREGLDARDFKGNYGEQVDRPGVYNVREWLSADHPTSAHLLFIATLYGTDFEPTMEASNWLDQHCLRGNTQRFVPNPNPDLKAKFFGPSQGSPWRIEVREYSCGK